LVAARTTPNFCIATIGPTIKSAVAMNRNQNLSRPVSCDLLGFFASASRALRRRSPQICHATGNTGNVIQKNAALLNER